MLRWWAGLPEGHGRNAEDDLPPSPAGCAEPVCLLGFVEVTVRFWGSSATGEAANRHVAELFLDAVRARHRRAISVCRRGFRLHRVGSAGERGQRAGVVSLAQDAADAPARAALSMLSSTQLRSIRNGTDALCPSSVSEYSTCRGTAG